MKVIQIIQKNQRRGAEIFASQLSQKLEKSGHQVLLVFLFTGNATLPFKGNQICLNANPKRRFWDWKAWKNLSQIIEDFQPDIIQANAGDTLKYAGMSRFFFRWKGKLIFRNANLISGFLDSFLKIEFNKFLLKHVDAVASVSSLCLQDFKKTLNWTKPIFYLPIGTEKHGSHNSLPDDITIWLQGKPYLVHIGSFVHEKNHQGLIRIFQKVKQAHPEIRLILCGAGPNLEYYKNLKLEGVYLAGERNEVSSILSHAKVMVLPSLIEGLPGVILEAMILEVPVVAYNVGGISELIKDKNTGFLINGGEENDFVEKVLEVLNPTFLKEKTKIIHNAKQLVQENYTLAQISTQFEKAYLKLLKYS